MPTSTFVRVLSDEDKGAALREAVLSIRSGKPDEERVFEVDPSKFSMVPGSPFAYWVSDHIRGLFTSYESFESRTRAIHFGLKTCDDFRFVRAWWEVPPGQILDPRNGPNWHEDIAKFQLWCKYRVQHGKRWVLFDKGGSYSPLYHDIHLVVNWKHEGSEIKASVVDKYPYLNGDWQWVVKNVNYYFRYGISWPVRARRFNPTPLPAGCIFSQRAYSVFFPDLSKTTSAFGILNSKVWDYLFRLHLGRFGHPEYLIGIARFMPWPLYESHVIMTNISIGASLYTTNETSLLFGYTVSRNNQIELIKKIYYQYDLHGFKAYSISESDVKIIESFFRDRFGDGEDRYINNNSEDKQNTISQFLGILYGRYTSTYFLDKCMMDNPLAPLPVCSPAMLQDETGLPATETPPDYPIDIPWDGILVDDEGHDRDLVTRIQLVMEVKWPETHEEMEADICHELGVSSVREYLKDSGSSGFWHKHIKQYSKSRRKAPIYWQLSTPSCSYSIWLYYHRFDKDTFFKILTDYLSPKLEQEELKLFRLRKNYGEKPIPSQGKELDAQEKFVEELKVMKEELEIVAPLWNPDLNDGVIINFALLWRLIPHNHSWQKECKKIWDDLAKGEYDWSHLAFHLWPERVIPKCASDRSLAIAHGFADEFWIKTEDGSWEKKSIKSSRVQELVNERTSASIVQALNILQNGKYQ